MKRSLQRFRRRQRGNPPLPPPIPEEMTTDSPSPFAGGKPLTEHEHKLAEDLHDLILGGQDGIVNVLGSILGIAAVTQNKTILIAGGLAGLFAEAISMAAVAFTSTRASVAYYERERADQAKTIEENPYLAREVLIDAYERKGFKRVDAHRIVTELTHDKGIWLEMLMEEHLHLYRPEAAKPLHSAAVVGIAATVGSAIPLIPFFFLAGYSAILVSILISGLTLFGAGAFGAKLTVGDWKTRGLEIAGIGMVSALVGFGIGLLFTKGILSVG